MSAEVSKGCYIFDRNEYLWMSFYVPSSNGSASCIYLRLDVFATSFLRHRRVDFRAGMWLYNMIFDFNTICCDEISKSYDIILNIVIYKFSVAIRPVCYEGRFSAKCLEAFFFRSDFLYKPWRNHSWCDMCSCIVPVCAHILCEPLYQETGLIECTHSTVLSTHLHFCKDPVILPN